MENSRSGRSMSTSTPITEETDNKSIKKKDKGRRRRASKKKLGPDDLSRALVEMKGNLKKMRAKPAVGRPSIVAAESPDKGPQEKPRISVAPGRTRPSVISLMRPSIAQFDAAPQILKARKSIKGKKQQKFIKETTERKSTIADALKKLEMKGNKEGKRESVPRKTLQQKRGKGAPPRPPPAVRVAKGKPNKGSEQSSKLSLSLGGPPPERPRARPPRTTSWSTAIRRTITQQSVLNRWKRRRPKRVNIIVDEIGEKAVKASPLRPVLNKSKRMRQYFERRSKVRGRPALTSKLPLLFQILTHPSILIGYEVLMCTCVYIYFLQVTYQYFFAFENRIRDQLVTTIDYLFVLDLLLRLCIEVWRQLWSLEYQIFLIPTTLKLLLVAGAAYFPLAQLANLRLTGSIRELNRLDGLRFNRLLSIYRIFYVVDVLDGENYLTEFHAFIIRFLASVVGLAHLVACLYFSLAGASAVDHMLGRYASLTEGSWLENAHEDKVGLLPNPFNNYLLAVQLSISMFSSTGYGALSCRTELEMLLGVFVMLLGAVGIGGYFPSLLTGLLLEQDGARHQFFLRSSLIRKYLMRLGAPAILADRTREYYECLWNFREGVFRVESIRQLPSCMYEDILYDICYRMFQKSYLFRQLDEPFLRDLSKTVQVNLYPADMIVCRQGEPAATMYYIIQGECLVKTAHSINDVSAILRPGCIFGESSLLFSLPHATNIETRICCQFLVIHKEAVFAVCQEHPEALTLIRSRLQKRLSRMHREYQLHGEYPITWVKRKPWDRIHRRSSIFQVFADDPVEFRWASDLNGIVPEDETDTTDHAVIVHMPPVLLGHRHYQAIDTYENCVARMTFLDTNPALRAWHAAVQSLSALWLPINAWRLCFKESVEYHLYGILSAGDVLVGIIFGVDVIVQIFTAVPSTGVYYKFWDGIKVMRKSFLFYIDILSSLPAAKLQRINTWLSFAVIIVGRFLKLIRANEYMNYLDERFPLRVFWLRALRILLLVLINCISAACLIHWFACPPIHIAKEAKCAEISWINSYYLAHLSPSSDDDESMETEHDHDAGAPLTSLDNYLRAYSFEANYPFTTSLYFAMATFTSSGFGDFTPQSPIEFILIIAFQFWSTCLAAFFTAKLTSALAAACVTKLRYEEKIISVKRFFHIHGISMRLRDRIVEHYKLRHHFNRGILLPAGVRHLLYDAPPYISDDALYAELSIHLEGVPVFCHADPSVILTLGKLAERYVLPPNITFVRRGDVRRQLYIIGKGSVAVMRAGSNEVKAILTETGHFGLRDLLYGEPAFNDVRTLSYCVILVIDTASFNLVFDDDNDLQEYLNENKRKLEDRIRALNYIHNTAAKETQWKERKPTHVPSWIRFPTAEKPDGELCSYDEFIEGYDVPLGRPLWYLLMHRTVHPAGTFALAWLLMMACASLLDLIITIFESLPQFLSRYFVYFDWPVKIFFCLNAYVQLHWAFYTEDSRTLICHPVQTAMHCLLDGRFLFSFLFDLVPYSWMFILLQSVDTSLHGDGFRWPLRMQTQRVFHLPRLGILFQFGRNVASYRAAVLTIVYVIVTLAVGTCMACLALYLACPWDASKWDDSFPEKLPACPRGKWVESKQSLVGALSKGINRWVMAVYYIFQAMFAVGYGDLVTPDQTEMWLMIFTMLFGYLALRVVQADITASSDVGDETRLEYSENMKRLQAVMRKQGVARDIVAKINETMEYQWLLSKGLEPHELMKELHPALQTDLFHEYVGNALKQVPFLAGVDDSTIRTLCTYLRKVHFLHGAPLTRRGGLEFEMYIIVDGYVWIAGDRNTVLCCLGPGETIGETQMIYGMVRRYTAVAATNVEALALDAADFSDMLEHYPSLLHELEAHMNFVRADLFERKIQLMESIKLKLGFMEYSAAISRISKVLRGINQYEVILTEGTDRNRNSADDEDEEEDESHTVFAENRGSGRDSLIGSAARSSIRRFVARKVFSWGPADVGLPYFYLVGLPTQQYPSLLLHPRCGFLKQFSTVVLVVSWVTPALALYVVVFAETKLDIAFVPSTLLLTGSVVLELIYFAHVVLQFFTAFPTIDGKYCKEHNKVVFRYVTSVSRFGLDVISLIPVELIPQIFLTRNNFKFFNLIRMIRLVHYYRSLYEGYEKITVSTFQYHFVASVTTIFLMFHLLACIFYGLSPCLTLAECKQGTWTYAFVQDRLSGNKTDPSELAAWKWYIRSIYWVTATITTTGFGDIVPSNLREVGLSIVVIFCGAFLLAIILSEFTHGVTSRNKFQRSYSYQLKIDVNYLESLGLSRWYSWSFVQWCLIRWENSRGVSYRDAVQILPLTLQKYVNIALYGKALAKVPMFDGMEPRFFLALASHVEHTVFLPGQVIVNHGDVGNKLFIVAKGRVSGFDLTRHGHPRLVRWYGASCVFGRLPTLFYNQTYTKTYRAEILTEVLMLSKHSIFYLARYFDKFAVRLRNYIEDTYEPELGIDTIFTEGTGEEKTRLPATALDKKTSAIAFSRFSEKLVATPQLQQLLRTNKKLINKRQAMLRRGKGGGRPLAIPEQRQTMAEEELEAKVREILRLWRRSS